MTGSRRPSRRTATGGDTPPHPRAAPLPTGRGPRRWSTALVLAASSTMISVGLGAWWLAGGGGPGAPASDPAANPTTRPPVALRLATPEATAETFLDAWRKRDHEIGQALATGALRDRVAARAAEDRQIASDPQAQAAAALWGMLAQERLTFVPSSVEVLGREDGGQARGQPRDPSIPEEGASDDAAAPRLRLEGTAEGRFFDRPYKRRVRFIVRRVPPGVGAGGPGASGVERASAGPWRVEDMELGDQLVVPPELRALGELDVVAPEEPSAEGPEG